MKPEFLALLRCPLCRSQLLDTGGKLRCEACAAAYPVLNGVSDLTGGDAGAVTAENFSHQWTLTREGSFEPPGITYNIVDRELMRQVVGPFVSKGARTVLDAGCGAGTKVREAALLFPEVTFIGLDIGAHLLAMGECTREIPNLHYVRGSLDTLPLAAEAFDFVVCHGVLHHIHRQPAGFEELLRVTRHGGHLSLWLYPDCRDLPSPFVRSCFVAYYGVRAAFFGKAYRLGVRACRVLAVILGVALFPFLLVLVSPTMHRFLKRLEGDNHVPRTLGSKFRSVVFGIFDDLIPEVQTRYSLETVRGMAARHHCRCLVTYADDSPLEFNRIAGFHLIEK